MRVSLIASVAWILRHLPYSLSTAIGRALGWVWFYLVRTRRRLCMAQLQAAFPEWSPRQVRHCTRQLFTHLCVSGVEFLMMDRVVRRAKTVLTISGQEHYDAAKALGRGVLVLTAHLGNWELLLSWATSFTDLAVVSKTPTQDRLSTFLSDQRERFSVRVFPTEGSVFQILSYLQGGGSVGFVIDQHFPGKRGIHVPFFNRWAATTTGLATLARKSGAPVVPVFITRRGAGHHVHFGPVVPYEQRATLNEELHVNTAHYSAVVEQAIRQAPEQWLWLHRRWKGQPARPRALPLTNADPHPAAAAHDSGVTSASQASSETAPG